MTGATRIGALLGELGLALLLVVVMGLVVLTGRGSAPVLPEGLGGLCVPSGAVPSLGLEQAANAESIVAVAMASGAGASGGVIGVMTALTESGLRDLGNPAVRDAAGDEGLGTNLDSVGLFQQRASWGPVAARMDVTGSAVLFFERLLALPDWQEMLPWQAAQSVQRSAYDGSNYEANYLAAVAIVAAVQRSSSAQTCSAWPGGLAGPAESHGLPGGYTVPGGLTQAEQAVVTFALAQLGKPYVWGGDGPDEWDCSGLTMAAWARAGVSLPHFAAAQYQHGVSVAPLAMVPGDLVFVPGTDGTLAEPGHVGIYLGDGLVLSAVDSSVGVAVQTWQTFTSGGLSGVRQFG
jgi:cell wall-associated NlpC family hydrolase